MVGGVDSLLLLPVVGLVVLRKLNNLVALFHEDGSAVAGICAIDVLLRNEDNANGGAGVLRIFLLANLVIEFHEAAVECALVVLRLPFGTRGKYFNKVLLHVRRDFGTTMPVKDSEEVA